MKKIQSSSYKKAFDFSDPNSNWNDDLDKANDEMKYKQDPGAGRMHKHLIEENMLILVYKMPMDNFSILTKLFLDLQHAGFAPQWEENTGNMDELGIMLPGKEYKDFLLLQKTNPQKWGEPE